MLVQGYICECCDKVFVEKDVLGLQVEQPDLFQNVFTYAPSKKSPDKCTIHFCTNCHYLNVVKLLENQHISYEVINAIDGTKTRYRKLDRAKDEQDYKYYYDLYSKQFYERLHHKHLKNVSKRR